MQENALQGKFLAFLTVSGLTGVSDELFRDHFGVIRAGYTLFTCTRNAGKANFLLTVIAMVFRARIAHSKNV